MRWDSFRHLIVPPWREWTLIALLSAAFALDVIWRINLPLPFFALLAVLPTFWGAVTALRARRMSIDTFNSIAVVVSFATHEYRSAGFIALMLASARLLDWHTAARTHHAMEELLKLKPAQAVRERDGSLEEIPVDRVQSGDVLIVKQGSRVPVDGIVVHGTSYVNESSVTGESALVTKIVGDAAISSTLVESGLLKIRATRVGNDSTIERMAALMKQAAANKSRSEKLADRFAGVFLPVVGLFGLLVYLFTRDLAMTAALFLVACADDMAVAIPLAMTASLGMAAKRGVIIKGGEWLDALGRLNLLILDKTGTLTFGSLAIKETRIAPGLDEQTFWKSLAIAEKYSEHPIGRAAYREAAKYSGPIPDPDDVRVLKGSGIWTAYRQEEFAAGNEQMVKILGLSLPDAARKSAGIGISESHFFLFVNKTYAGTITVADIPRPEAAESIQRLRQIGIHRILMFTGDNQETAANVARTLGIAEFRAAMSPEMKLHELEALAARKETIGMVGDGINDAPALARADVGIAMGGGGTAVAAEAADVIILTDNLSRLPEMILLGRKTLSVVRGDMIIWFITNLLGFALVLTGIAGPALAAFYNFATDFVPILNSSRLFREKRRTS